MSIPGRVVVFDYGEVISRSPDEPDTSTLLGIAGVDAAPFWAAYWRHRLELDHGTLSVVAYWRTIAAEVGALWTLARIHELWAADFRSWWRVEAGTLDLIEELHEGGTRLALLSNAGLDFAGPFHHSPMASLFERVFVSAELDAVKPDPAIYTEVADRLGIPLDRMVFVDNKVENTDAAAALGVTVHHFTAVAGLDAFLRSLAG